MLTGLLLAGLPEKYSSLVMAFGGSAVNITSDLVKSKRIEEVKYDSSSFDSSNDMAQGLLTCSSNFRNCSLSRPAPPPRHFNDTRMKRVKCFKCNRHGHLASDYTITSVEV